MVWTFFVFEDIFQYLEYGFSSVNYVGKKYWNSVSEFIEMVETGVYEIGEIIEIVSISFPEVSEMIELDNEIVGIYTILWFVTAIFTNTIDLSVFFSKWKTKSTVDWKVSRKLMQTRKNQ